jgi:hypothetical protein
VNTLRTFEACRTGVAGITQFTGYLWDPDGPGPAPPQHDTALDFVNPGPTLPQIFVEIYSPACVEGGTARRAGSFAKTRGAGYFAKKSG